MAGNLPSRSEPYVSAVIGVYNMQSFIGDTVRSVLSQTFTDFELVIVDDGSTDGTADEVARIDDARIRLVRNAHVGSATARNVAIGLARGTLVAFLDGDDLWAPDKLITHINAFREYPHIDVAFDLIRHIDEHGNDTGYRMAPPNIEATFENILMQGLIPCGSVTVVRREALAKTTGFCPELPAFIDLDLWLRLALLRPNNTICIPKVLTAYRRHSGQITGKWRRMAQAWPMMMARLEQIVPERLRALDRQLHLRHYRDLAFLAHEQNDRYESWKFLLTALAYNPWNAVREVDFWRLSATMLIRVFLPARVHQTLRSKRRPITVP